MHRQTGQATTQHTKKGKFWTKRPERANFGLSDQNRKCLEIVLKKGTWITSTAKIVLQLGLFYHKRQFSQPIFLEEKDT